MRAGVRCHPTAPARSPLRRSVLGHVAHYAAPRRPALQVAGRRAHYQTDGGNSRRHDVWRPIRADEVTPAALSELRERARGRKGSRDQQSAADLLDRLESLPQIAAGYAELAKYPEIRAEVELRFGYLAARLLDWDRAIEHLSMVPGLTSDPDFVYASHYVRAWASQRAGRRQDAIDAYRKAIASSDGRSRMLLAPRCSRATGRHRTPPTTKCRLRRPRRRPNADPWRIQQSGALWQTRIADVRALYRHPRGSRGRPFAVPSKLPSRPHDYAVVCRSCLRPSRLVRSLRFTASADVSIRRPRFRRRRGAKGGAGREPPVVGLPADRQRRAQTMMRSRSGRRRRPLVLDISTSAACVIGRVRTDSRKINARSGPDDRLDRHVRHANRRAPRRSRRSIRHRSAIRAIGGTSSTTRSSSRPPSPPHRAPSSRRRSPTARTRASSADMVPEIAGRADAAACRAAQPTIR